jgi:hypothetical protein
MGSIIFLQMLLDLVRFAGGGNSIYGKLLKSLRFVVFLAPPFGGSSLADWAKVYIGRGWPIPILQHGSKEIGVSALGRSCLETHSLIRNHTSNQLI